MYLSKYYVKSIQFAIEEIECKMTGNLTPEQLIKYEEHVTILKQLIADNTTTNGNRN